MRGSEAPFRHSSRYPPRTGRYADSPSGAMWRPENSSAPISIRTLKIIHEGARRTTLPRPATMPATTPIAWAPATSRNVSSRRSSVIVPPLLIADGRPANRLSTAAVSLPDQGEVAVCAELPNLEGPRLVRSRKTHLGAWLLHEDETDERYTATGQRVSTADLLSNERLRPPVQLGDPPVCLQAWHAAASISRYSRTLTPTNQAARQTLRPSRFRSRSIIDGNEARLGM
jgi:hypothetical protein